MRLLALTMFLAVLAGCPEEKNPSGETTAEAHPLLVAQCQAGTTSACAELDTKCKDGDEAACTARAKIGKTRSVAVPPPAGEPQ